MISVIECIHALCITSLSFSISAEVVSVASFDLKGGINQKLNTRLPDKHICSIKT